MARRVGARRVRVGMAVVVALTVGAAPALAAAGPGVARADGVERTASPSSSGALVSAATGGEAAMVPAVSADGRFVVFHTEQGFLVPGDTNGLSDVFLRDRLTGDLTLVSKPLDTQSDGESSFPDISRDGRWIVFHSRARNLVDGDLNDTFDVFRYDRLTRTTARVSLAADGTEPDGPSYHASISDDGRFVAFHSLATNLVPGDTDAFSDVYVKDMDTGAIELVSVAADGSTGDGDSFVPDISADGRYVAFESGASNLVVGDANAKFDVFVRDRLDDVTTRISRSAEGGNGGDNSFLPQLSADGRYVAFESYASNLVVGDVNGVADVFVVDRAAVPPAPGTVRVSEPSDPAVQAADRSLGVSISDDGATVAFQSWAANLVPGDTNEALDVFLADVATGTPVRLSEADGAGGNGPSGQAAISGDGSTVVFESLADNLGVDDADGFWDVYVHSVPAAGIVGTASPARPVGADQVWAIAADNRFDDVRWDDYFFSGVSFLLVNGITTGTSATTYEPAAAVTRGQMATFLFRLAGSQRTLAPEPFDDVAPGTFFYQAVKWAYGSGLTTGTTPTTFSPWEPVTRGQMAMFLWRLAGSPWPTQPSPFTDVHPDAYYARAVQWLAETGITSGTSATTYSPNNAVTRGQMAAFLERLALDYGWTPTWAPIA